MWATWTNEQFTAAIIAISTIVETQAVTGVALATENIAKAKTNRVKQTEANARGAENERNIDNFIMLNNGSVALAKQLDKHEYLSTLTARSNNNLFNANDVMSKVTHLLTDDKIWGIEYPDTELYQSSIKSFVIEGICGLTKAEYGVRSID